MTSSRSGSVAEKLATTVPGSDDSAIFFSELYALNTGTQSFSPVIVTVTCTRHSYVTLTSLTDRVEVITTTTATRIFRPAISCPAFSCPAISCSAISGSVILRPANLVRHFHVRHFQSTLAIKCTRHVMSNGKSIINLEHTAHLIRCVW